MFVNRKKRQNLDYQGFDAFFEYKQKELFKKVLRFY